jgi:hypothetical protein
MLTGSRRTCRCRDVPPTDDLASVAARRGRTCETLILPVNLDVRVEAIRVSMDDSGWRS